MSPGANFFSASESVPGGTWWNILCDLCANLRVLCVEKRAFDCRWAVLSFSKGVDG